MIFIFFCVMLNTWRWVRVAVTINVITAVALTSEVIVQVDALASRITNIR